MKKSNGNSELVSTSELCRLIGVSLTVNQIIDFSNLHPAIEISPGTYWKRSHVPVIASMVSSRLAEFAANFQLMLNEEKVNE